jgi:hypothetical protein
MYDPASGGVMITVQKAKDVTIFALSGDKCGQSTLHVTPAVEAQWQKGAARYNSNVPLYGGCIGIGHRYPDGGAGACPKDGPACSACHGPMNPIFQDVAHTPEQAGGFSDKDLIDIVTNGTVPDGGYFDPSIVSYPTWSLFHKWTDIQGDDQEAMVVYLRSLPPAPQSGSSNFGGHDAGAGQDAGGTDAAPPGDGGSGMPPMDATVPTTVSCGATTCSGGEVCCVPAGTPPSDGGINGTCTAAQSCSGFALHCNGAQDCATGEVCCMQSSTSSTVATCQTSCSSGEEQVCQKVRECPMGDGCRNYSLAGGVQVCLPLHDAGHDGGHKDSGIDDGGGD